jgi:hypothetical protein
MTMRPPQAKISGPRREQRALRAGEAQHCLQGRQLREEQEVEWRVEGAAAVRHVPWAKPLSARRRQARREWEGHRRPAKRLPQGEDRGRQRRHAIVIALLD